MYLYKIMIRKPITLFDAIEIARPFLTTNMKQVFYTESKHHYTFINIKRKYFLSNDFDIRTNRKTTIYLGELKHPQFLSLIHI